MEKEALTVFLVWFILSTASATKWWWVWVHEAWQKEGATCLCVEFPFNYGIKILI